MPESNQIAQFQKKLSAEWGLIPEQMKQLQGYAETLLHWRQKLNLTGNLTLPLIWERHIADSLEALQLQHLPQLGPWADLGSGAGLPAIPLAIALPQIEFQAWESVNKKNAFQAFCRAHLGIKNLHPRLGRVEEISPAAGVQVVSARALAALPQLLAWGKGILPASGTMILWKGETWKDELAGEPEAALAAAGFALVEIHSYAAGKGVILVLKKT